MKYRTKSFDPIGIVVFLAIMGILILLVVSIISNAINTSNKIDEGVIVDKNYSASYVLYTYSDSKNTTIRIPYTVLESYSFTIRGEKNGESVEYTFSVTEDEYPQYNIGDYYKRYGNWKIKAATGLFFKRTQAGNILEVIPDGVMCWVRCWDLAASEKTEKGDSAYTAGVLVGKRKNGRYIVADVINRQMSAADVRSTIKLTAQSDKAKYKRVRVHLPQDPGQAGKEQAESYIKFLSRFDVVARLESGSKQSRAEPMAAQWQAGNFDILHGDWNEEYLTQLENFPDGKFKDMVDASANAFSEIEISAKVTYYKYSSKTLAYRSSK